MNEDAAKKRRELYSLLGDLPPQDYRVSANLVSVQETESYLIEKLELDLNGLERVPAYFVKPKNAQGPLPCVLYNHAHGGNYALGKDELLAGRPSLQSPPYAEVLTASGYAVLCLDTWCFGERSERTELDTFKEMLWQGQVLWGMMLFDSLKAVDYLCTRADVDKKRIATLGLSMGSTMAWWLAALDTRINVCIDLCCLTDFDALIAAGALEHHSIYYYVPSLLKQFSSADINALIAPRPHLSLAGLEDVLTPVAGLERIDKALQQVYSDAGATEAWQLKTYKVGHLETAEMRTEVMAFLQRWL